MCSRSRYAIHAAAMLGGGCAGWRRCCACRAFGARRDAVMEWEILARRVRHRQVRHQRGRLPNGTHLQRRLRLVAWWTRRECSHCRRRTYSQTRRCPSRWGGSRRRDVAAMPSVTGLHGPPDRLGAVCGCGPCTARTGSRAGWPCSCSSRRSTAPRLGLYAGVLQVFEHVIAGRSRLLLATVVSVHRGARGCPEITAAQAGVSPAARRHSWVVLEDPVVSGADVGPGVEDADDRHLEAPVSALCLSQYSQELELETAREHPVRVARSECRCFRLSDTSSSIGVGSERRACGLRTSRISRSRPHQPGRVGLALEQSQGLVFSGRGGG